MSPSPARRPLAAGFVLLLFAATSVCAPLQQSGEKKATAKPKIHGVVLEPGTLHPVSEAEVLLFPMPGEGELLNFSRAKALATTTTDANGAFRLAPEQFGSYRVEVKKEGYGAAAPFSIAMGLSNVATVKVSGEHPLRQVQLMLAHPGQVSGRLVDEETRKPIAKMQVFVECLFHVEGRRVAMPGAIAVTDSEGQFVATGLIPADYVVWIRPRTSDLARIVQEFSEKDLERVDLDYEESYWPGGSSLDTALPVRVGSGAAVDVGRMALRRVPYYSVRVSFPAGGCESGEKANVGFTVGRGFHFCLGRIPCNKDFLMRGFAPGSHKMEVVVDHPRENRVGGLVAFDILDKNMNVSIPLVRGVIIDGRVVPVEGASKPALDKMRILADPIAGAAYSDEGYTVPDKEGAFRFDNARAPEYRVSISGMPESHYIKEIRYNGIRVRGNTQRLHLRLDPSAMGHSLEIVVDDKPASLIGSVTDRDRAVSVPYVVLIPWPQSSPEALWPVLEATGDEDGKFQFRGLAPGDYRILAVSPAVQEKLSEPNILNRLLVNAKTITLGASAFQTVPLELTEIR
jgi:hypothetical protein